MVRAILRGVHTRALKILLIISGVPRKANIAVLPISIGLPKRSQ